MNRDSPPASLPAQKIRSAKPALAWLLPTLERVITCMDCRDADYADPEHTRHARLVARFGVLGFIFGSGYALFYLLIGHKWGAGIISICSVSFGVAPFWLRRKKDIAAAGHFLNLVLTFGFTSLCFCEGGLEGHAIAWLVSVPLIALLLLGLRAAILWSLLDFLAGSVVAGLQLAGYHFHTTFDHKWSAVVSAAGYLGLIIFMFFLGLIFEIGRTRALAKVQQALAELGTANERLQHLNNEKNEFLGMAAHDLKNPLAVIVASVEMIDMTEDKEEVSSYLTHISDAATRMCKLISDLLDVNAIEQGKFASKTEPCDMRALVEKSIAHNQSAATRKSITIRLGASEGLWAKADPNATLQILDNLVSNALKYSPPNTTTHVHTLLEAKYILVSVRDEGPGISDEDQKKLFQKYTRLSARPTAGESSTGLGLNIVKRLAEAMSGTVQCHSSLGAGSTFTLRLPVCPPPPIIAAPLKLRHTTLQSQTN
jgi:signal transduction histidine kinase